MGELPTTTLVEVMTTASFVGVQYIRQDLAYSRWSKIGRGSVCADRLCSRSHMDLIDLYEHGGHEKVRSMPS